MTTHLPSVPDPNRCFGPGRRDHAGGRDGDARRAHRLRDGALQGVSTDYSDFYFYFSGRYSMNGRNANTCLFHEPESGRSWDKVRWWCLLEYPEGSTAITPRHSAAELAQADGDRVVGWEVVRV